MNVVRTIASTVCFPFGSKYKKVLRLLLLLRLGINGEGAKVDFQFKCDFLRYIDLNFVYPERAPTLPPKKRSGSARSSFLVRSN